MLFYPLVRRISAYRIVLYQRICTTIPSTQTNISPFEELYDLRFKVFPREVNPFFIPFLLEKYKRTKSEDESPPVSRTVSVETGSSLNAVSTQFVGYVNAVAQSTVEWTHAVPTWAANGWTTLLQPFKPLTSTSTMMDARTDTPPASTTSVTSVEHAVNTSAVEVISEHDCGNAVVTDSATISSMVSTMPIESSPDAAVVSRIQHPIVTLETTTTTATAMPPTEPECQPNHLLPSSDSEGVAIEAVAATVSNDSDVDSLIAPDDKKQNGPLPTEVDLATISHDTKRESQSSLVQSVAHAEFANPTNPTNIGGAVVAPKDKIAAKLAALRKK